MVLLPVPEVPSGQKTKAAMVVCSWWGVSLSVWKEASITERMEAEHHRGSDSKEEQTDSGWARDTSPACPKKHVYLL